MELPTTRFNRVLLQLKRRTLFFAVLAALGLLVAGFIAGPSTRGGAVMLGVATSILASVVVAASALEREEFAQRVLDLGVQGMFDDRLQGLQPGMWTRLLSTAERRFKVLGMANHGYLNSDPAKEETRDALRTALTRPGVDVEFLWLDPMNALAELRETEENRRLRVDICESIIFFWQLRSELPPDQQNRLSLREYTSLPTCGVTWADDHLIVTHYLAGGLNLRAPGVVLTTSRPRFDRMVARLTEGNGNVPALAHSYTNNYREVASDRLSTRIVQERVDALRQLKDRLTQEPPQRPSEAELRMQAEGEGQ